ncbi:hypothetical protein JMJ35_002397 [Cladonia borealis]|uniref:Uncharacterized protein n=1 Tax=Cladonia borealis TaxID=184061 RepID=A0AA39R813_9LECA|nr:hypothetical protein JMJ35_002397 [Cladonia borealis]
MPVGKLDGAFLAPLSGYNTTTKVMAAQANLIDGGCLLSVYFLHSFVDVFGASLVMGAWAENCRKEGLPLRQGRQSLGLPSSPILRQDEYERLKKRPELWNVLGLDWPPVRRNSAPATSFQNTSIISTSIFSATPTTVSKLEQDASPAPVPLMAPNGQKAAGWISTKDALAALLWRCIMKARFPSQPVTNMRVENYNSVIAVAMDGRKSLAIPINYVGNVVFESMTELLVLSSRQRPVSLQSPPPCMDLSKRTSPTMNMYAVQYFVKQGKQSFSVCPWDNSRTIRSVQPRQPNGNVEVVIGLEVEQMERLRADPDLSQYLAYESW